MEEKDLENLDRQEEEEARGTETPEPAETAASAPDAGAAAPDTWDLVKGPDGKPARVTVRIRDAALMGLIRQVESETTRDYIENRVVPEMGRYGKMSGECKKVYFRCMTASIVLGALIPVVSVFSDGALWLRVLTALLGTSITGINAYLALQNSKELWQSYRNIREELLRTLYFYFNGADIFREGSQESRDARLVDACEAAMAGEGSAWRSLWKKANAENGGA